MSKSGSMWRSTAILGLAVGGLIAATNACDESSPGSPPSSPNMAGQTTPQCGSCAADVNSCKPGLTCSGSLCSEPCQSDGDCPANIACSFNSGAETGFCGCSPKGTVDNCGPCVADPDCRYGTCLNGTCYGGLGDGKCSKDGDCTPTAPGFTASCDGATAGKVDGNCICHKPPADAAPPSKCPAGGTSPDIVMPSTPMKGAAGSVVIMPVLADNVATTVKIAIGGIDAPILMAIQGNASTYGTVVVKVPSGAMTGPITASNDCGTSPNVSIVYTVLPGSAPTVSSHSPATATSGITETLTGTGFTGATEVQFWVLGLAMSSNNSRKLLPGGTDTSLTFASGGSIGKGFLLVNGLTGLGGDPTSPYQEQ
jgi:hypothetical protein